MKKAIGLTNCVISLEESLEVKCELLHLTFNAKEDKNNNFDFASLVWNAWCEALYCASYKRGRTSTTCS